MLNDERLALRRTLPELAQRLEAAELTALEAGGSETLSAWFRDHGWPDFLVPAGAGGRGRCLAELTPLFRAVAAACPSLAVMMLMHHHTVGAFCFDDIPLPAGADMLRRIAGENSLVASAFAESRPGVDLLDSSVTCRREDDVYLLDGYKKPCTLSHHADLFLVGVTSDGDAERSRGLVLVDRRRSPVQVEAFWPRDVLRAADSHCVRFCATPVAAADVMLPQGQGRALAKLRMAVSQSEITLSSLFQLLMASAYLGMASRLCELGLAAEAPDNDRLLYLACEIQAACLAQDELARRLDRGNFSAALLGLAMATSYNALCRINALADEVALHEPILAHDEARYLAQAIRLANRHPPSASVRAHILASCYRGA